MAKTQLASLSWYSLQPSCVHTSASQRTSVWLPARLPLIAEVSGAFIYIFGRERIGWLVPDAPTAIDFPIGIAMAACAAARRATGTRSGLHET